MKAKTMGILLIVFGGILSTIAIFLKTVPYLILSFAGKILIAVGMLILFAVKNEN